MGRRQEQSEQVGETVRAKAKTGKGVVSPRMARPEQTEWLDHTSVERQEQHERQQQR